MTTRHRQETLQSLRALLRQRASQADFTGRESQFAASSPVPAQQDAWSWLPASCLAPGTVTEWCTSETGGGCQELAIRTALKLLPATSHWLWIEDQAGDTYPLALADRGIDLSWLATVRTGDLSETLWAVEQGLRSRGVALVVCQLAKITPVVGRRLKLAAETGGSRCLLLRGREALRETSFADVRLLISPLPSQIWQRRRLQVELLKIRNGLPGGQIQLELSDETDAVRVVSELARPESLSRATGA